MIPILYLHEHAEISGGETSLLVLWEHLDRQRFRPVLLTPTAGPLMERAGQLGVPGYVAQIPRFRELLAPSAWRKLAVIERMAREIGPHILHGNNPHTNLAAALVGRRLGCRVVWHERTLVEPHEWDVDRWLRFLPDRIVCNSAAVAKRFGTSGGRIRVIYNGAALQRFRPDSGGMAVRQEFGLAPDEVAIGIVGHFAEWKRHELVLEAVAHLGLAAAHARLLIVGGEVFPENRGREARLRTRVSQMGLERRVIFAGRRQDMPAVMDALDVLVSASEVEACSRAIIEAMAAGTPVAGADAGGTPELILPGKTGLLFPAGDAHGLARALCTLIQEPSLRHAMGRAARERAETHFNITDRVKDIEALYESIL